MANHSLDIYDLIGPEPDLGPPDDLHRWDKWVTWFRRKSRACWQRQRIDEDGFVIANHWWGCNLKYWRLHSHKTKVFKHKRNHTVIKARPHTRIGRT